MNSASELSFILFPNVEPVNARDKPPGDDDGTAGGATGLRRVDSIASALSSCSSSAVVIDLYNVEKRLGIIGGKTNTPEKTHAISSAEKPSPRAFATLESIRLWDIFAVKI